MLDKGLAAGARRRIAQQAGVSPLTGSPGTAETAFGTGPMAHIYLTLSISGSLKHPDLIITGGSMPIPSS